MRGQGLVRPLSPDGLAALRHIRGEHAHVGVPGACGPCGASKLGFPRHLEPAGQRCAQRPSGVGERLQERRRLPYLPARRQRYAGGLLQPRSRGRGPPHVAQRLPLHALRRHGPRRRPPGGEQPLLGQQPRPARPVLQRQERPGEPALLPELRAPGVHRREAPGRPGQGGRRVCQEADDEDHPRDGHGAPQAGHGRGCRPGLQAGLLVGRPSRSVCAFQRHRALP
mmetsp:Transcript_109600/g.291079  ORF Transcript_109600/g.291079 Transcript_109600/m.291079 type:complete len:225 (-) Transcript_109600:318-992(-)